MGVQKIMDWPDKLPTLYRLFIAYIGLNTNLFSLLLDNSPNLNAIEAAWPWLKRRTTSRGAPQDKKTGKQAWINGWNELPQENIQQWIEQLVRHIQEVIEHDGGNVRKGLLAVIIGSGRGRE